MTVAVVIADANILFSRTLRDYELYGDDASGFEVRWSTAILAEMSGNLRAKRGLSQGQTDRLEELMNAFLDDALVDVRRGSATVAMRNDVVPYMTMRSPTRVASTFTASDHASIVPVATGVPAGMPASGALVTPAFSPGQRSSGSFDAGCHGVGPFIDPGVVARVVQGGRL